VGRLYCAAEKPPITSPAGLRRDRVIWRSIRQPASVGQGSGRAAAAAVMASPANGIASRSMTTGLRFTGRASTKPLLLAASQSTSVAIATAMRKHSTKQGNQSQLGESPVQAACSAHFEFHLSAISLVPVMP
jgi:hypothetical protein